MGTSVRRVVEAEIQWMHGDPVLTLRDDISRTTFTLGGLLLGAVTRVTFRANANNTLRLAMGAASRMAGDEVQLHRREVETLLFFLLRAAVLAHAGDHLHLGLAEGHELTFYTGRTTRPLDSTDFETFLGMSDKERRAFLPPPDDYQIGGPLKVGEQLEVPYAQVERAFVGLSLLDEELCDFVLAGDDRIRGSQLRPGANWLLLRAYFGAEQEAPPYVVIA